MNVAKATCASSNLNIRWHSIKWAKVNRQVKKLQIRIAKATQEGRHGKVKALEWLLTHSFSAKALAVRRVTENQGKRTAGIDGEIWLTPESKANAIISLKRNGYKPKPLRRVYIPKAGNKNKKRPLGIPTMIDRAYQTLHKMALEPIAETTGDINSYGFRPERATTDAIAQCFNSLSLKSSAKWILEGDIKGCFDNINHEWLLKNIPMDRTILAKWLNAGYVDKGRLFPTKVGTPQGSSISVTLCNMTLDGLEKELRKRYSNKKTPNPKVNFIRYADDFIVTGNSKELLENEVKPIIKNFLEERGLALSEEKTKITHIDEGLDFLGVNIRKHKGTILIKPSKDNVKVFLEKVRRIVKSNKTIKQEYFIRLLNPVIRGWANYHRGIVAKRTFHYVDYQIFKTIWKWAKRRHPNKSKEWLKDKYFKRIENRDWVFTDGEIGLVKAADVKIKRHIKIKTEANPFDPKWETYFEKRLALKMMDDITLTRKLRYIWRSQNGKCLICRSPITKETGWNIHHVIPRVKGGNDNTSNLVVLHPNCHKQAHSHGLTVVKPSS